jgi:hypothetical protein
MTKFSRTANGKYSVSGKTYDQLIGTRAQVWHGTAYKTTGGLTKTHIMKNKSGRIVSKAKHNTAKKEKRLVKAGFLTKKGHFGFIKKGKTMRRGGSAAAGSMPTNVTNSTTTTMTKPTSMPNNSSSSTTTTMKTGSMNNTTQKTTGGRRRRRQRGGSMYPLSPSPFHGNGVGTSGVDLQIVATNA